MPNPFSNKQPDPDMILVTNSTLICEYCFIEVSDGEYEPKAKRLTFVCPNGHINEVRNIDI